ncbi:MAG: DsbA family oxidoreductase [Cyanobacteriota bacterium]|nr:DsbA family oxidoreductase [Cyanobacteriota bacterium]
MNAYQLEIVSDFICPWCFVAETRLQRAIAQLQPTEDFQMIWQPFELNPNLPEPGIDRKIYRSQKFGSWAYSQQLDAQTILATQDDKIEFDYDRMAVTPNTLKAHRLTGFAAQQNLDTAMVERILRAYFSEGQPIGEVEVLSNLAAEVGLDRGEVRAFLESDAGTQEVRNLERQIATQGIRGVPSIRIGANWLSGARSVAEYRTALQQMMEVES